MPACVPRGEDMEYNGPVLGRRPVVGDALSYTAARAGLRALLDEVTATREPAFIRRRGREDVAVLPADELRSLLETAYLLRSPANAARLEAAAAELDGGGGLRLSPSQLRSDLGLADV